MERRTSAKMHEAQIDTDTGSEQQPVVQILPRVLRRYLPDKDIQPDELSPFGITESETGAKVAASSVRNYNTFNVERPDAQWIAELNQHSCSLLKTSCDMDDVQILREELDRNPDLLSIPLREPDPHYIGRDTYITVTAERELHRFSSHRSLGLFPPTSSIRQAAIRVACSAHFQVLLVCIILLDFLALVLSYTEDPIIKIAGDLFFALYCAELVVKIIAYGFIIDRHSFLRNGHSIVEFVVVVSGALPMIVSGHAILKQVRVIRVVRLFRLISSMKFGRKIMRVLASSVKDLVPVFVLFLAIHSFFSLVSLVFYKSTLLGKCVNINYAAIFAAAGNQSTIPAGSLKFHTQYLNWTDNMSNWQPGYWSYAQRCPVIGMGDSSWWMSVIDDRKLRNCSEGYRCMRTSTGNPDMGYSNYDTLMLSMLSTFRLLCQDWWDNLYTTVTLANGGHATTLFFLALIFLGSHYVINLVLSTISLAYTRNEEAEKANMEEIVKLAVIMHINRENQIRRQVEIYNLLLDQGRTSLIEPKFLQYLPHELVSESANQREIVDNYVDEYRVSQAPFTMSNLNNVGTAQGSSDSSEQGCLTRLDRVLRNIAVRNKSDKNLPIDTFVNFVILMNVFEMLVVMPWQKQSVRVIENNNLLYTFVFTLEALLKICYQRTHYLESMINRFDLLIVIVCQIEIMLPFADSRVIMILRMTRFLRLFKLARVSKELEKLITIVLQSFKDEVPLIIVSFTIVIVSAGIGMVMFQDTYKKHPQYLRPTQNFVDFYNSILLVFRIMCGEWIENLWVCMKIMETRSEKGICVAYFLMNQIIVSLVIFKLFVGILLNKFGEYRGKMDELAAEKKAENELIADSADAREPAETPKLMVRVKKFLNNAFGFNFGTGRKSSIKISDTCFSRFRRGLSSILSDSSSWYGTYIMIMTVLSSAALVLDDYYLKRDEPLRKICDHLEIIFLTAFATEMMLKLVAYGPKEYIRSPWRILDAAIVLVTLVDLITTYCVKNPEMNLAIIRVFRTLRCLRILRTANVWEGFRLTISALFRSMSRLVFAFIIVLIVWLMFALVSTSMFSKKFYRCVDENSGEVLDKNIVKDKVTCLGNNYTWENKRINFDTSYNAMLALLEVAVFKGWIDIFQDISNSPSAIDLQPDKDRNSSMSVFIYIIFIVIGSFFMMGLLIGVIVDSFEEERQKISKMVMTDSQKKLQNTLTQILMYPLKAAKPKPDGWLCRWLYHLNTTVYVEVFYLILILTSTLIMALQYHPGKNQLINVYLNIADDAILLCFVFELVMKMLAEGSHYLNPLVSWNLLDFVIVMLAVLTNVCNEAIDLEYLRVVRFARIFRMGRLLAKSTSIKTVRDILLAMVTTLPSMLNMISLLIMAICIFSIIGVSLFNDMGGNNLHPFNEMFGFRTFVSTWRMLFIVSTAAGFNDYLDGTMRFKWPYNIFGVVFWVTYLCLSFFVLTNLIVSAVVSSYNEVFDSESSTVKLQTAEAFTNLWNDFDQRGNGRIHSRHISELLDLLSEPLRVQQPNTGVISLMAIPLSEDLYVSHTDMVKSLIWELMDRMGLADPDEMPKQEQEEKKPLMDTFTLHKLRLAANAVKAAWWQRKLRHAAARLEEFD